jgi:uncharacterized protein YyaL (SSP411 family)
LDADTQGQEGLTYVWTPAQLREVLGDEDGRFAADLFDVTEAGTFEHGTSVLRLARDIDEAGDEVSARWARVRTALYEYRLGRPQPGRDDKVVAAWCGLAITALVEYGLTVSAAETDAATVQTADRALERASAAARLLVDVHLDGDRLRRASRDGVAGSPAGVLDDYGCVAEAFCALHQVAGDGVWLERAGALLDTALARFANDNGGFFDTADDAERLVARPADPTDNATPSGLSSLSAALVSYTALTGETRYRQAAQEALETVTALMTRHPRYAGYACAVAEAVLSGPYEIAISVPEQAGSDTMSDLVAVARRQAPPGAVIVAGPPDLAGAPLLAGRTPIEGQPTAYVCRGFVCDRPVTTAAELTALLAP